MKMSMECKITQAAKTENDQQIVFHYIYTLSGRECEENEQDHQLWHIIICLNEVLL